MGVDNPDGERGTMRVDRAWSASGLRWAVRVDRKEEAVQQFNKLLQDTIRRRESADYLSARLAKIPGIAPARLPAGSCGMTWVSSRRRMSSTSWTVL